MWFLYFGIVNIDIVFCIFCLLIYYLFCFFFSSRRRHTRCALVTGVQTCALPISGFPGLFLFMERQLASISPGEAAIEVMRSSALILVAWRHRFAAFFIPPFLMRFVGRFLQDHLVLDPIDPARDRKSTL